MGARIVQQVQDLFKAPIYGPLYGSVTAFMVVIMLAFVMFKPATDQMKIHQTNIAEVRNIKMPDGSIVTLGAHSKMMVSYTQTARSMELLQGQAFFDVKKDQERPFYVRSRNTTIKVMGTKFDVNSGGGRVTVGVLEGRVRVQAPSAQTTSSQTLQKAKILIAGQTVSASSQGFAGKIKETSIQPGAWREGRLDYKEALFSKVIADANRYYKGDIILKDQQLANTAVTTSFNVGQVDVFLKVLPDIFAVDVEYGSNGQVIIQSKKL